VSPALPLIFGSAARSFHSTIQWRQSYAAEEAEPTANPEDNGLITNFQELAERNLIHPNIIRTITERMGLRTLTDVQSQTIESSLRGNDMVAQAKTGTGKTVAFLLPILQKLLDVDPTLAESRRGFRGKRAHPSDIRALIISPTRELAEQIATEARKLTSATSIVTQTAVGGTHKRADMERMRREGCHILVGTPGRLKDVLSDPYSGVSLPNLDIFVLDEADRLLDQGFWPEVQEIQSYCPRIEERDRQSLLFSATIPREVITLVQQTLKPGFDFVQTVQENEVPTHERVKQHVVKVNGLENLLPTFIEIGKRAIAKSNEEGGLPFKAIVYFNSTAEVKLAQAAALAMRGPESPLGTARTFEIHSRLTQAGRTNAAESFRRAQSAILFSSDVTARGMDFPNVTHVIQVGLPASREQYIHRIGRTGRAGKEGEGWLLASNLDYHDIRYRLRDLPLQPNDTLETAKVDMSRVAKVTPEVAEILNVFGQAMRRINPENFQDVYKALLGTFQSVRQKQHLVDAMNALARYGWNMTEPPRISGLLARKLGLDRTRGLSLQSREDAEAAFASRGGYGSRAGGYGSQGGYGSRGDFGSRGGYGSQGGYGSRGGNSSRGGYDSQGGVGSRGNFGSRGRLERPSYNNGGTNSGVRPVYGGNRESRPGSDKLSHDETY
jgi:ATP-dependent RNA helicase MSS116